MSQKFKSDIETQAGLIDSFGFTGTAGQVLSSTGTKTEWITPPQSPGGGGSSQVFYFNGGTASSVGGYYQMSPVANTGTAADFTINANGYIASFLTDVASPNQLNIPAGNWNFEIYFSASSSGGSPSFYVELYKYSSGGVFTLIASSSAAPEGITNGTAIDAYFTPLAVPTTTLLATDRLAVRVYVTHSGRTITMHTQNGHLSEVITTFSTGLTALNGLTEQVQYFSTGTAGTDFNISSATDTHTFNLPTASAVNRGALSSADWTTFNSKANASGTVNYVSKFTGATTLGNSQIFDNGTNVGIGTTSPGAKLQVAGEGIFDDNANGRLTLGFATTQNDIYSTTTGFGAWKNFRISSNELILSTGGANERMRITSVGNVGIGTTSPNALLQTTATNASGIISSLALENFISTNPANGNGVAIDFRLNNSGNPSYVAGKISLVNTFFRSNTDMIFSVAISDTLNERMRIASNGAIKFNNYGSGSFTGTATQKLAVDSSGNVIEIPIGGGAVDGSGTTNYVTKWLDADTIGNSQIFDNGANVGIGTNIPSAAFQVGNGTGLKNILISGSGNNLGLGGLSVSFLGFATGTISTVNTSGAVPLGVGTRSTQPLVLGTNNAERMRIDSSGNVGIGTTIPTSYTNLVTLSIGDNSATKAGALKLKSTYNSGDGFELYQANNGDTYFSVNSATTGIVLKSNGNVGIGTTSPSAMLTLNSTTPFIRIERAGVPTWQIQNNTIVATAGFSINNITNGTTPFFINGTNDNVGIGTGSPSTKLQINVAPIGTQDDGMRVTDGTRIIQTNIVGDTYSYRSVGPNETMLYSTGNPLNIVSDGQPIKFTAGTSERMRLTSEGYLLLGTTSSVYGNSSRGTFEINGSSNSIITLKANDLVTGYLYSTPTNLELYSFSRIDFATNGAERMRIASNGNVGIGTTSPGAKLDVDANGYSIIANNGYGNRSLYLGTNGGEPSIQATLSNGSPRQLSLNPSGGNVGIGTTSPNASAILHLKSNSKGFLPPSMSTADRDNIGSPLAGLMIFNEEDEVIQVFTNGSGWKTLAWA
jgi:hypothetical protein